MAASVTGCLPFLRAAKEPLPVVILADPAGASCTLVLLPGFWDRPDDFVRHGFPEELAARDLAVRVLAADAHVGYYKQRTILREVRQILETERRAGRTVWLAGNSLGGVGSLILARHASRDVEGVLLMAPYLGEPETIAEIRAAGGALLWAPPGTEPPEGEPEAPEEGKLDRSDYARETWQWLAAWNRAGQGTGQGGSDSLERYSPQIYLGWGVDDDFADPAELAAELLPEGHAMPAPGGHDWTAWTQNWRDFLDSGALEGCR